jgi:rhomboid protease GluP
MSEEPPESSAKRPSALAMARMFPVTSVILTLNILVFAVCAIATWKAGRGSIMGFDSGLLILLGADYGPLTLDGQWWRIISSMFLHGSLIHVGANMYCYWDLGRLAESVYGSKRYLATYMITGIASSVASLGIHPNSVSVGASGAIFGVAGALVFPFYRKRLQLPAAVMKSMFRSLGTFIALNLVIGTVVPVIDNAAHMGGLIAGLILGTIWTHFVTTRADEPSTMIKVIAASLMVCAAGFVLVDRVQHDRILAWQAVSAMDKGDHALALQKAQEAVTRRPKDVPAHNSLGEVYFAKADYENAAREFETSLRLDPEDGFAQSRLGSCYAKLQQWGKAEPLLRQALKRIPDDAETLFFLGTALNNMGRSDEALQEIRKAVRSNPDSAIAQYALGSLLLDKGDAQRAVAALTEAVRLDPQNQEYKQTLARAEATSAKGSR